MSRNLSRTLHETLCLLRHSFIIPNTNETSALCGTLCFFSVERLREQWDETRTKLNSRQNSLDDMLLECRQFQQLADDISNAHAQITESLEASPNVTDASSLEELRKAENGMKVCVTLFISTSVLLHRPRRPMIYFGCITAAHQNIPCNPPYI